ncbi:hypothetical protein EDE15_5127 [Edaphobacter aggregans]|uniref:Flagellar FliJ protein n=1 Tax=Edaphobacter aggregans TaxID=570835 RepID=A0A3R9P2B1_9BACT|nr:hypothetical protein [Edaphobacter aggregans]RSL19458.1 hypothetical protein EDE15_5127 [Edaphobacter aggregans]
MRARLKVLQRLAILHGVVERTHAAVLERRATEVREAEEAIDLQHAVARSAVFEGRAALIVDDRMGWSLAEAQRELAGWRCESLERIRMEREALRASAHEQYAVSRIKSEQMRCVVQGVETEIAIEEGRRSQAAMDDRYLSRRSWVELQRALRDGAEIKGS